MKKVLVLLAIVLGATNMYAQDYDLQGLKKIIENAYRVGSFHSGRAKVVLNDSTETTCYIDKKGNVVFRDSDQKDMRISDDFSDDGLLPFSQTVFPHKMGCLDINGNIVVAPKHDAIYKFNNGIAIVNDNRKYGAIDTKGNIVIPIVYNVLGSGVSPILNGKYTVGSKEGKLGFVDKANNFYSQCFNNLPNGWENQVGGAYLNAMSKNVDCGLYPIAKGEKWSFYKISPNAKWGYHNHLGIVTIPCTFDSADMFSEGMAKVSRNGQWGYIDMKGNIVIPLREDLKDAGYFHEGFALIKSNGKFGYIDKTGKVVIPCNFDFAQNFNEGMALVGNGVKKTFINKEGKTITDFVFDYSYTNESFSDGLALVMFQGKWGYIDKRGNTTFPSLIIGEKDKELPPNAAEDYGRVLDAEQKVYDKVETMPSFVGGQTAMFRWISEHLQYPEEAMNKGIKGRVVASFYVEKDGTIGNVEIEKSVHPLLDNETIRLLKSMPKWIPGTQDGSPVRVKYTVPLTYNFTEE